MNTKKRTAAVCCLAAAVFISAAIAYGLGINPPIVNIAGAFATVLAAAAAGRLIKIPDSLYYTILVFIFFASPVGSVLDLYRLWDPYDKIVHLASGMLLAAAGYVLAVRLLEKTGVSIRHGALIVVLMTFFVSSAGAGLWEIFEFTADKIAGGGMQRGMVDTVTDMIAGNAGGLLYSAGVYWRLHGKQETEPMPKRSCGGGA